MSTEVEQGNLKQKKKGGKPCTVIQDFYIKGLEQGDSYRAATCPACNITWQQGKISIMKRHILVDCKKVDSEIKEAVYYIIETREKSPENTTGKKRAVNEDQKSLEEFFETQVLS